MLLADVIAMWFDGQLFFVTDVVSLVRLKNLIFEVTMIYGIIHVLADVVAICG